MIKIPQPAEPESTKPGEAPCSTYTVDQAAKILGISRWAAYQAAREGELPTIRIGKRLIVPRAALERMLAG
jgi:excisionase family DNA binding protein